MTNNTIPNVPRELLNIAALHLEYSGYTETGKKLRTLLDAAPSPAGVDGCKCSMSIRVLGDGCRHCQPQEYIDRLGEMLDEERAELSDAQAIIDGLRGEVEEHVEAALSADRAVRHQQAQRIGELEGLLRKARQYVAYAFSEGMDGAFTTGVDIDAAISASKEGE